MNKKNSITLAMAFSVGFVLFSSHAGGAPDSAGAG